MNIAYHSQHDLYHLGWVFPGRQTTLTNGHRGNNGIVPWLNGGRITTQKVRQQIVALAKGGDIDKGRCGEWSDQGPWRKMRERRVLRGNFDRGRGR